MLAPNSNKGIERRDTVKYRISVIIPAYNSERHIEAAVDSVLRQTMESYEVIIIDDASTDNTYTILQSKYSEEKRIRLFRNNKNYGQGLTRNIGISYAAGEYLFFLDSDDTIEPNALQRMYEVAINKQADIVICGIRIISETGEEKYSPAYEFETSGGIKALELLTQRIISVYVWDKLYKKDFIERYAISFPPIYQEDIVFVAKAVYYSKSIVSITDKLYNYYLTSDSTSRGKITEKHIYSSIEALRLLDEFIGGLNDQHFVGKKEVRYQLYDLLTKVIIYYITKFYNDTTKMERDEILHRVFQQQFGGGYFYIKTMIDYYIKNLEEYNLKYTLKILKTIKHKKIIFFGTGDVCCKILEYFPLDISYLVDNDQNKWNQRLQLLNIYNPSMLKHENKSDVAIIVVSKYYSDISLQLDAMGFRETEHYWNGYKMYNQLFA